MQGGIMSAPDPSENAKTDWLEFVCNLAFFLTPALLGIAGFLLLVAMFIEVAP